MKPFMLAMFLWVLGTCNAVYGVDHLMYPLPIDGQPDYIIPLINLCTAFLCYVGMIFLLAKALKEYERE